MRTPLILLLFIILLLVDGSQPAAQAEESNPLKSPTPVHLTGALLRPIAGSHRAWRVREVAVTRVLVFDQSLVLSLRAPDEETARWAIDLIKKDKGTQSLLRKGELRISSGVLRSAPKGVEIDVLFSALIASTEVTGMGRPMSMEKEFERAEMAADIRIASTGTPEEHSLGGAIYTGHHRTYKPATSHQFLVLTHNLMIIIPRLIVRAAHWEENKAAQTEKDLALGTSTFDLLQPSKTVPK